MKLTTKKGFHVDGAIAGSLQTFMENYDMFNAVSEINECEMPNTHNRGSQEIDPPLIT
jgi:hypothetical protein